MDQGKGIIPVVISCLVVAVVFAVVSFAVPFARNETYWIAFAFAWVSIVVAFGANLYVVLTAHSAKSVVYRASISVISILYLIAAAVVSLVFMANSSLPSWILIVIQVVLLALCLLSLIGGAGGASMVESGEAATRASTSFIQSMRMQANGALPFARNDETRRALTGLSEKLRFTDPMSSPATEMVDQQIANSMARVNASLQSGDDAQVQAMCAQMLVLIDEREAICRSTK